MPARTPIRDRYTFANIDEALSLPDLISVQRDSFEWFLKEGLKETFRDISPIKDFTETLQLELEFDPDDEDLRPPPKFSVEECKEKDMTYSAPIFVRARFINAATGEIKEQTVFMGDFPMMTDKGTFVINGTERVVVSQLVRSPGVIFEPGERYRLRNLTKHQLVKGTVHPYRGEWIEFDVEQKPGKDVTAGTRVARKRRLSIFILMRALGYGEDRCPGFMDAFVRHFDFLEGQWEKDREIAPTREEALVEIYKRARPGEPPSVESARAYFDNAFFQSRRYDLSRVGRYKLDKKLRNEIERLGELFPMLNGADEDGMPVPRPPRGGPAGPVALRGPRGVLVPAAPRQRRAGLPPRRPGPLRQPAHPLGRRADPEPGAHRPVPDGAGRARAHDHPGRRGDHAPDAHQHPAGGRRHQGVLRHQPALPVHGPGEPAVGPHPPPPPVGARSRRSLPRAGRLRGPRRPLLPLRPHVPDRDARGPEHRPDRRLGARTPG